MVDVYMVKCLHVDSVSSVTRISVRFLLGFGAGYSDMDFSVV